jgi:hypothetical protein
MIKLTDLLKEIQGSPKAIIMAGGASVGKSTVLNTLKPVLKNFVDLNADKYVEDKDSPMFGNLSAASSQIRKKDLPNTIANKQNLVYDTTASNLSTLQPVLDELNDAGYETAMIMVYDHPIVSFIRNFKRERKVPAVGVLGTWGNVYSLINDYKRIFGDDFILVSTPASTPEEKAEMAKFDAAVKANNLNQYFEELLSSGQFVSTFRKDDAGLSPEELEKREKQREKTKQQLQVNINKVSDTFKKIQSDLNPVDIKELPNIVKQFIG